MKNEQKAFDKLSLFISIGIGLLIAGVFSIFFRQITVSGNSMNDTLKNGQRVIIRKNVKPKQGDIIVCNCDALKKNLIKRVIAVEGDTIEINFEEHTVTVNGEILDEPYIKEPTAVDEKGFDYPVIVPEDCYFVMGDNRNHSIDSRDTRVGFVKSDDILGMVLFH